jgi:putative transposase
MDLFEDALERVRLRYLFVVAGYVVMPEHVHLLVNEPKRPLIEGDAGPQAVGFDAKP